MYHHFTGKADLARAAIRKTAQEIPRLSRVLLDGQGSPLDRLSAYLRAERDVLRGCRVGRLVQDREIVADAELRQPIDDVFTSTIDRLTAVLREAQEAGEVRADVDPEQVATMLLSAVQGAYVIARAHQDETRFTAAIEGAISLVATGP
jgi:AcrR family transcriptional regulator